MKRIWILLGVILLATIEASACHDIGLGVSPSGPDIRDILFLEN